MEITTIGIDLAKSVFKGIVIDGRPRFAKPSLDVGKQVEIAAIDPDCDRGRSLCP